MAGGYDIQLSKLLNRTDLQTKYTGDSDYAAGILYVELPAAEVARTLKKPTTLSKRGTSKGSRVDLEGTSDEMLKRDISGTDRYTTYFYDGIKHTS